MSPAAAVPSAGAQERVSLLQRAIDDLEAEATRTVPETIRAALAASDHAAVSQARTRRREISDEIETRTVELLKARLDHTDEQLSDVEEAVQAMIELRRTRGEEWTAAQAALEKASARLEAAENARDDAINAYTSAVDRRERLERERRELAALVEAHVSQVAAGA